MPAALPPVNDCNCSSSSSSSSSSGGCCPITGTLDPNVAGVVPSDTTVWAEYLQLLDAIAGPPTTTWKWNPNLRLWQ